MFVTKRALRKENRKLKELLQKCQNLQGEVKDSCLNANCILCEHCVMPQSDLPLFWLDAGWSVPVSTFHQIKSVRNFTNNAEQAPRKKPIASWKMADRHSLCRSSL